METKLLKTSVVGGFNKDDVGKFFEKLENEHVEQLNEVQRELEQAEEMQNQLENEKDELSREKEELLHTLNGAVIKLKEKQSHIFKMQQLVKKQCEDNEELSSKNNSLDNENTSLLEEKERLAEKLTQTQSNLENNKLENISLHEEIENLKQELTSHQYQLRASNNIIEGHKATLANLKQTADSAAEILANARKKADCIISQANEYSNEVKQMATAQKAKLKQEREDAEKEAYEIIEDAKYTYKSMVEHVSKIKEYLFNLFDASKQAISELEEDFPTDLMDKD